MKTLLVICLLLLVQSKVDFNPPSYFSAHQIRLFPTNTGPSHLYSIPNPGPLSPATVGLALSGYDLAPGSLLSFNVELAIDHDHNRFQLRLSTANTQLYNLNYFLISVASEVNLWLQIFSQCFIYSSNSFSLNNLNRLTTQSITLPFPSTNTLTLLPFIRTLSLNAPNSNLYFNITQITATDNSTIATLSLFANYSYTVEACVTILAVKEGIMAIRELTQFEKGQGFKLRSSGGGYGLAQVVANHFGISDQYGPLLQGKCFVGLQSIHLRVSQRDGLNFDISTSPPTSSHSQFYSSEYNYFCLANIACPPSFQYYPLLDSCQSKCALPNCTLCSSSTSCLTCSPAFYLNPLLRCSPCMANCISCTNNITCDTCADGLFYSKNMCQLCPLKCLKCTASQCLNCSQGYLTSGQNCISCSIPMPHCLICHSAGDCALCEEGWIYDGPTKGCVQCQSKMANCQLCNFTNNCQRCMPTYYLKTFNLCQSCSFSVQACCQNYVNNCQICLNNNTCSKCKEGYYVNETGGCQSCGRFGKCGFCNSSGCLLCMRGYYGGNGSCLPCARIIENCGRCENDSVCLECNSPYQLAEGKCLNCPIWPVNYLYFMDQMANCLLCQNSIPHCQTCKLNGTCLSCNNLHYLRQSKCLPCSAAIPDCLSCLSNTTCSICAPGFTLSNGTTPLQCLQCSQLPNCLQCQLVLNSSGSKVLICLTCNPSYYAQQGLCRLCGQALSNCQQCAGSISCLFCSQGYFLTADGKCATCSQIIPGCTICQSASKCFQCSQKYTLQGGYCSECQMLMPNCLTCSFSPSLSCNQCTEAFHLSNNTCLPCTNLDPFCLSCTPNKCQVCISTYISNIQGQCLLCSQLIDNCQYCDQQLVCRSCLPKFVYDPWQANCLACGRYTEGCEICEGSANTLGNVVVNCTKCLSSYISLPSQSNTSNLICLSCNASIPHCLTCASLSVCSVCNSDAFKNSQYQCSLCRIYLLNCLQCSNASQCTQCQSGFVVGSQGLCQSCNLNLFGIDSKNSQFLCLGCLVATDRMLCSECVNGSYLVGTKDKCQLCSTAIDNCRQCINNSTCIRCSNQYYLTQKGTCLACSFPHCLTCTVTQCLTCLSSFYLKNNNCFSCSPLFPHCLDCTSQNCLSCIDGYYLNGSLCLACSTLEISCLLCNRTHCLIRQSLQKEAEGSVLFLILGIAGIVGTFIVVAVMVLCWQRNRKGEQNQLEESDKPDTHRRMNSPAPSDVQIDNNQLCHFCLKNQPEAMQIELLCGQCSHLQFRGHKHKISQSIRKSQFEDKVIEDNSVEVDREKMIEMNRQVLDDEKKNKPKETEKKKRKKGGLMSQYRQKNSKTDRQ